MLDQITTDQISTETTVDYSGTVNVKTFGASELTKRFLTGQSMPTGTGVNQPYKNSIWVYVAIKLLSDLVESLPLKIVNKTSDEPLESGNVYDFWHNHNNPSLKEIKAQSIGWKQLTGELHWILDNPKSPSHIDYISGAVGMKAVPSGGIQTGWEYCINSNSKLTVPLEQVISDIYWSPYNKLRGLSPLAAAALSISQDYQAANFNNSKLANQGEPSGILSNEEAGEEESKQALEAWQSRHGGSDRAGKIAALAGGWTWQSVASTYVEMQFSDLRKMTREEILAVWHIPKVLVGLAEDANYGFADAEQEIFWNNTMRFIVSDYNDSTRRVTDLIDPNVKAYLDIKDAPIFNKLYKTKIEQAVLLLKAGATLNNVNDKLDLGLDENEWGDHFWLNRNMTTAQDILDGTVMPLPTLRLTQPAEGEDIGKPKKDEDDDKKATKKIATKGLSGEQKIKLWRRYVNSWAGLERQYRKAIADHVKRVHNTIAKNIETRLDGKAVKMTFDVATLLKEDDKAEWIKELRKISRTHYKKVIDHGIEQIAAQVGVDAASLYLPEASRIERLIERQVVKVKVSSETIRKTAERHIRKAMQEGAEAGDTIQDITNRIKKANIKAFKVNRSRALTIARTETAQVIGSARRSAAVAANMTHHAWIAERVNARDTHRQADTDYSGGITLHQPFIVGGYKLWEPSDPNGPPQEIINCRCLALYSKRNIDLSYDEIMEKGFKTWMPK